MTTADYIDSPYGRSVKEWRGKTPDSDPPQRVRQRVFDRKHGRCHKCTRKINGATEKWTCEHLIAICNRGENRERNLDLTCSNCLPEKNAADVAQKSIVATKRKKHLGIKRTSRPIAGSRASKWKHKLDGTWERRT